MEGLARKFSDQRVKSAFVYTREAHPGEKIGPITDMEHKLANARHMARRWGMKRPMLVDDLEGTVHRAYGTLPNMAYILARRGMIHYRASWTDAHTISMVLDHMAHAREQKRERKRIIPFYTEWYPDRQIERGEFMAGLLEMGGVQAVEEFISAIGEVRGPQEASIMQKWWDDHRSG